MTVIDGNLEAQTGQNQSRGLIDVLTEEEKEARRTVEVTVDEDFPLSDDIFLNHFESSRNGGGKVDDVRIHEEERVIHVIFEEPEGRCSST